MSTPPLLRLGCAALLTVAPVSSPALQTRGARNFAALTGSFQRHLRVSVVYLYLYVKRWFVLWVCALQSGHVGVGYKSGEILIRYSVKSGYLFVLSCARVLPVYLGSVCSCALFSVRRCLIFCCLSLFVGDSALLMCEGTSYWFSLLVKWWRLRSSSVYCVCDVKYSLFHVFWLLWL